MIESAPTVRIAVLVKQVPDITAIEIDRDTRQPVPGAELVMNTYDAYAIGEAINLKETSDADLSVICAGPDSARDVLIRGLATGADRAIHIVLPEHNEIDTLALAGILASILEQGAFDLILTGQTTDDCETGQVPIQLAELLGCPHVSLVTHVQIEGGGLRVNRDAEASEEVVTCPMPAVLMVLSGRNAPQHHPSLRGMIAARRKPFERVEPSPPDRTKRLSWSIPVAPEKSFEGIIVRDEPADVAAAKLIEWLRDRKLIGT